MKQIKIFLPIVSFFSLFNACSNICQEYLNTTFLPLEYKMVVTGKYIDSRFFRIIGRENSGIIDTTQESAILEDEYNQINIGDSLIKKKNSLDVTIIKKDTTIVTPHYCHHH